MPLETETAVAGAIGERCNAPVVLVSGAVEDHVLDAGSLRPLGDQAADLLRLLGLVAGDGTQRPFHGGSGGKRTPLGVVRCTGAQCEVCDAWAEDETAPYKVRMLPGQEPYAPEELRAARALVADAARAEELFGLDELERSAEVGR